MTLTTLSAYLDDFLAMKRVRAEVDARSGPECRQLRYIERLLRSFLEFWQARGCPWPIRAAVALDWVAVGTQAHHPYRDQHRVWAVRAFLYQVRAFELETEIPPNIFRAGRRRRRPDASDFVQTALSKVTRRPNARARPVRVCAGSLPIESYRLSRLTALPMCGTCYR